MHSAALDYVAKIAATTVAALAFGALAVATGARANDTVVVIVDQARVVKVPEKTTTLVIGNPIIADVTLLKSNNTMIITGKGYGETNLIALDAQGNPVAESTLQVRSNKAALIVQRGMDRESYNCAPRCQPTVNLGDTTKYMTDVSGQIQARNGLASGAGK